MVKKINVLILLIISINSLAQVNKFYVVPVDGANVVPIILKERTTWYNLAEDYNCALDLLKLFNEGSTLQENAVVNIPLTETNYFKNTKVTSGIYQPLYFSVSNTDNVKTICKKFIVPESNLFSWNNLKDNSLASGQELQIGWFKNGSINTSDIANKNYKSDVAYNKQSTFKADVKKDFNNAKNKIKNLFSAKTKKGNSTITINEQLIENKKLESDINNDIATNNKTVNKSNANSLTDFSNAKVWEKNKFKQDFNAAVKRTKTSLGFNATKPNAVNTMVSNPITTKDSLANTKEMTKEVDKIKEEKEETTKTSIYDLATINKSNVMDTTLTKKDIETEEITHKIESTTTTTSTIQKQVGKGNAGWFYSGAIGNEYYAFTNLATRGAYLEVKYLTTTIKVKVLGQLKTEELNEDKVILLSDNAKTTFGVSNKLISVVISAVQ